MPTDNRLKLILTIIVIAIIAVFSLDPIAQEPDYHNFADQRRLINIANFFNVLSNLPFVIIGILGMRLVGLRQASGGLVELQSIYLTFFAGVFLNGFGSAHYHYQPGNQSLFWDRLPMTIAFMSLFCAVVGEYISTQLAGKLFIPLLITGVTSVNYWYLTELNGHGDLRAYALMRLCAYALVQFLPLVLIPLIL
ncbi:ceramidase domain-containing protein [Methylobacter svalbardensis]|uniref:ceramidase domain-containing protein n=1 Tax=Methylobacter svalbardensis TaxID=3080016 RepID=UPI0030EB6471